MATISLWMLHLCVKLKSGKPEGKALNLPVNGCPVLEIGLRHFLLSEFIILQKVV